MMANGEMLVATLASPEEQQSVSLLQPPEVHDDSLAVGLMIGKLVMNLNPGSLQKRMTRVDMVFGVTQLFAQVLNYGRPDLRHLSRTDTLGIHR